MTGGETSYRNLGSPGMDSVTHAKVAATVDDDDGDSDVDSDSDSDERAMIVRNGQDGEDDGTVALDLGSSGGGHGCKH